MFYTPGQVIQTTPGDQNGIDPAVTVEELRSTMRVEMQSMIESLTDQASVNEREKVNFPLPRHARRISSSAFLNRRPFGYYLPTASYGTIFTAKWSSNGGPSQ